MRKKRDGEEAVNMMDATKESGECREEKAINKMERGDDKYKEDFMNTQVRTGRVFLRHG